MKADIFERPQFKDMINFKENSDRSCFTYDPLGFKHFKLEENIPKKSPLMRDVWDAAYVLAPNSRTTRCMPMRGVRMEKKCKDKI